MNDINRLKDSLKKYLYLLIITFVVAVGGIIFYYKNLDTISGINSVVATIDNYQDQYLEKPNLELGKTGEANNLTNLQSGLNLLDKSFTSRLKNFISNIGIIENDYKTSKENLNIEDPRYYFNLGNLYLFSGYYQALSGQTTEDYITSYLNIFQSKNAYDKILQSYTGDALSQKANTNKNMAEILEYLVNVKLCISIFDSLISRLNNLLETSKNLKQLFDTESKQLAELINNTKDETLKQCLQNYQEELKTSYGAISAIDGTVNKFIEYSIKNIDDSVDQKLNCYEKKQEFTSGLQQSVGKIENGLNSFMQIHGLVSKILESKDPEQLEAFCKSNGNNSGNSDKLNKDINKGLEDLNNILNQNEQQQPGGNDENKNPDPNNKQDGQQPNSDQQGQKTNNQPQHQDILNEDEKNLMENVENKNMNWIEEMQDIKGSGIYDPNEYLNNLFKEFKGNSDDFNNNQLPDGPNSDNKW